MKAIRKTMGSLLALAAALAAGSVFAAGESHAALAAQAKIGESQAKTIALAQVPRGRIKDTELERKHGRLIWSFDIAGPDAAGITEIQVDAKTGAIASVNHESPSKEGKEAQADEIGK